MFPSPLPCVASFILSEISLSPFRLIARLSYPLFFYYLLYFQIHETKNESSFGTGISWSSPFVEMWQKRLLSVNPRCYCNNIQVESLHGARQGALMSLTFEQSAVLVYHPLILHHFLLLSEEKLVHLPHLLHLPVSFSVIEYYFLFPCIFISFIHVSFFAFILFWFFSFFPADLSVTWWRMESSIWEIW